MIDYLTLIAGVDIPFPQAKLIIHQPTIKEIAYIGEDVFFSSYDLLNFSKEKLELKGDFDLEKANDFDILMMIIKEKVDDERRQQIKSTLLLLFPQCQINFLPTSIMLSKDKERFLIDRDNFHIFKDIINQIFCMKNFLGSGSKYNPGGPQARALVQKFKKRQKKLAELRNKGKQKKIQILSRYISILSVGEKRDMNSFLNYTVFQLMDEFTRFRLRQDFEMYVKCKLAGAQDVKEVKNWMSELDSLDDD